MLVWLLGAVVAGIAAPVAVNAAPLAATVLGEGRVQASPLGFCRSRFCALAGRVLGSLHVQCCVRTKDLYRRHSSASYIDVSQKPAWSDRCDNALMVLHQEAW